ncbi:MFS transporter [Pimelobacter simplex]|uniref:Major facilitator family transporter n=1 Tax=Nocardioides simplex TaxID=2045 RepID=A0A0C5XCG7_NOCSI|nr:MFS transporter [Pimelobacter simplex]AJR18449.1 Major facilitator family transporter [Pimelobacter simplex]MCG8150118.1 MFS transporter [Pimelobacter simplex]GEB13672.1 MFS transporter [Pimelobacter simplex]SFM70190.1 Predicted arabinose efflux permease, MFS family [Pimelobacter simplex]
MTLTSTPEPATTEPGAAALPWPALLVLGGATLVMVTGEMLPTAVLGPMSRGLGVTESATGLLVSLWAAVVVVASFPLVRLTRRWPRPLVVAGSLVAFAVAAALTALAPSYGVVLAGRTLGAASVGLLWSTVNAHVADLVPDRLLGRATSVVLGGATLGLVLGTPVGRLVADLAGWRASFALLAVASLAMAVLVLRLVPAAPAADPGVTASGAGGSSLRPMVVITLLVALVLVGHYGAYTFITRLAGPPALVLLVFGLASALGVVVAGRADRTGLAMVVATAVTAAAILAVAGTGSLALVVVWGVASGALPPLAQTLVLRLAGPAHRGLAGALIPVLFNGGIAVGAALASGVVARYGVGGLGLPAAALVAAAAAGLAAATLRGGPSAARGAARR